MQDATDVAVRDTAPGEEPLGDVGVGVAVVDEDRQGVTRG